jgi:hypothetical protein
MNVTNKIGVLLLFGAAGAVAAGEYFNMPRLYSVAIIAFGMIGVAGGLKAIVTGKAHSGRTRIVDKKYIERYSGAPARMLGVVLLLGGLLFVVGGAISGVSPSGLGDLGDRILGSPRAWGLILAFAGTLVTLMGIVRAKTGSAATPGTYGEMAEAEIRGGGMMATLAGVIMLVPAVVLIVAPGLFQSLADNLKNSISGS